MKISRLVAVVLGAAAISAAANAADLPLAYKAQPPVQTYSWTGCYLGGGGGFGTWNQHSYAATAGAPVTAPTTNGGSGGFGQGQVGCDYQFAAPVLNAGVVAGLFADYQGGNISGDTDFPGVVGSYQEKSSWAAGGRVGLLVTPRILTYLDGGYTEAHFDGTNYLLAIAGGAPTGLILSSHTYNGWFVGSGVEYTFDWLPQGLFLKTEYRYAQYAGSNGDNLPLTGTPGAALVVPAGLGLQSKLSTQTISTELVWRFNATGAAANAANPSLAYKAPPLVQTYNWTGCYLGGGGGYGTWNQHSDVTVAGAAITAPTTNGGSGGFGQGQVGCDYQFAAPVLNAGVVAGAFADYEGGNIAGDTDFPGAVGSYQEKSSWAAGGRVGLLATPRILSYLDGGYTQAHFDGAGYNLAIPGGGPTGLNLSSHTYNGWFVGSGFEYSFDWLPRGLFLKSEYRYAQYAGSNGDSVSITGTAGGGIVAPAAIALQSKLSTQMISTELVWRFNWTGH